ncbi:MAG: periplasmic heavy metal sensor [Desulfobaccales bacterium]
MKRGTLSIGLLLALGLILTMGFTCWAGPDGTGQHQGHWGHHGKFAKLTPEQVGKLFDLRQKFLDDTASLRKEKLVKKAELRALWRSENPDEKQILAKLKEINAVKAKLQEKFVPFRIEVKKILPKCHGPKGSVSMEEEDMNLNPIMAMEPSDRTGV